MHVEPLLGAKGQGRQPGGVGVQPQKLNGSVPLPPPAKPHSCIGLSHSALNELQGLGSGMIKMLLTLLAATH